MRTASAFRHHVPAFTLLLAGLLLAGCAASAPVSAEDLPKLNVFVTAGNRVLIDGQQLKSMTAREAVTAFAQANPGAIVKLCASPVSDPEIREALLEEARGAVRSASDLLAASEGGPVDLPKRVRIDESLCDV